MLPGKFYHTKPGKSRHDRQQNPLFKDLWSCKQYYSTRRHGQRPTRSEQNCRAQTTRLNQRIFHSPHTHTHTHTHKDI